MRATGEHEGGRRLALVIATASYADPTLAKLRAPGQDAEDLAGVLADASIGGFDVDSVLDAAADTVRRRVAQFCAQAGPRDLALIYLSCHGVLDDRGRLYYATTDTDRQLLSVTAVQAAWFNEHLEDCRCRRQVLVLDCCHSGAFAKGAKGDGDLALRERFEGRGRVVLTASRATEYSFEGDSASGKGASSLFTAAIVDGLRSGEADRDGDGLITVTELYDYAYHAVKASEARQTPSMWTYGAEGSLLMAHSPRGAVIDAAPLPEDLSLALESPRPRVREGAVADLAELLGGPDAGRALTAREQLARIAAGDIPLVAGAAQSALEAHPESAPPGQSPRPPAPDKHPLAHGPRPTPAALARTLARHRGRSALLALALLALVVAIAALLSGGNGGADGKGGADVDSERTGRPVSMVAVGGAKVRASAHLVLYSSPPPSLFIELTPGGKRDQLLLFDRLSEVRSFDKPPRRVLRPRRRAKRRPDDRQRGRHRLLPAVRPRATGDLPRVPLLRDRPGHRLQAHTGALQPRRPPGESEVTKARPRRAGSAAASAARWATLIRQSRKARPQDCPVPGDKRTLRFRFFRRMRAHTLTSRSHPLRTSSRSVTRLDAVDAVHRHDVGAREVRKDGARTPSLSQSRGCERAGDRAAHARNGRSASGSGRLRGVCTDARIGLREQAACRSGSVWALPLRMRSVVRGAGRRWRTSSVRGGRGRSR